MILRHITEAELAEFEADLAQSNRPEWSKDWRRADRRSFYPTYREARAEIRHDLHVYIVQPLRRLNEPNCPANWLTPSGVVWMHEQIKRKRAEHSALIRQEYTQTACSE